MVPVRRLFKTLVRLEVLQKARVDPFVQVEKGEQKPRVEARFRLREERVR